MRLLAGETFIITPDGVRLWTVANGDGPLTTLLSNGGPGCCDYLAPLAALIADGGRRTVRWEQRGVGRSGGNPEGPFTIAQCVADIEAIRAHYGGRSLVVAGHFWGADLSQFYALAHPDRCAGLLCVAGGRLNNDREWHAAYDRGQQEGREAPPDFAYPPNLVANNQLNTDYRRYIQRPTLFREIASLRVPALFVYGAEDIRPSWAVAQVAALVPAADSCCSLRPIITRIEPTRSTFAPTPTPSCALCPANPDLPGTTPRSGNPATGERPLPDAADRVQGATGRSSNAIRT